MEGLLRTQRNMLQENQCAPGQRCNTQGTAVHCVMVQMGCSHGLFVIMTAMSLGYAAFTP